MPAAQRKRRSASGKSNLHEEYAALGPLADRLLMCLREQLGSLIEQNGISLAVPVESRVKSLASIADKFRRKPKSRALADLPDLIGLRLILLFRQDVEKMDGILRRSLEVIEAEDTSDRLREAQFGYQSNHYVVRLPEAWLQIPSYSDLAKLRAEIQVRTLAQHMWAATSHKLQYKRENSVPLPLRRTIHRVSALLETVDLEFERVLAERADYRDSASSDEDSGPLNVDLLSRLLDEIWPSRNKTDDETYDDLLSEITKDGIGTLLELRTVLLKHKAAAVRYDKAFATKQDPTEFPTEMADRIKRGMYFNHTGLTRYALHTEKGHEWL